MTCHQTNGIMAPVLQGLFGKEVKLVNGQTAVVDEAYIRESILNPTAKVVAGYQPNMPTFQGQVTEDAILQLIAYIKSLGGAPGAHVTAATPTEGQSTNPATEAPAAVAPPTDESLPNAGTEAPAGQPTEPQADGTSSPNEDQAM